MIVLMGSDVSVEYMPLLPTAKYWVVTIPRTGMTALIHESVKCEWPCSSMLYGADSVVPRPVPSSSPITHTHTLRGSNAFHALVNHIPNSAHLCCIPYMYYQYYSLPKGDIYMKTSRGACTYPPPEASHTLSLTFNLSIYNFSQRERSEKPINDMMSVRCTSLLTCDLANLKSDTERIRQ